MQNPDEALQARQRAQQEQGLTEVSDEMIELLAQQGAEAIRLTGKHNNERAQQRKQHQAQRDELAAKEAAAAKGKK